MVSDRANVYRLPVKRVACGVGAAVGGVLVARLDLPNATLVGVLMMLCGIAWAAVPASGFPRGRVVFGVVSASVGLLVQLAPEPRIALAGWLAVVHGVGWTAISTWLYVRRYSGTSSLLGRWNRASQRAGGVASRRQWRRSASPRAMRRKLRVLVPSWAQEHPVPPWWNLVAKVALLRAMRGVPLDRYSTVIAMDGKREIRVPVEWVTGRVGGPRMGKTGDMARLVVDAPGAAVVTSTRTDIIKLTAPSREKTGPIWIYNPGGVDEWTSNIKWSPRNGCRSIRVAADRAADMIPKSPTPEGERWDRLARSTLGVLLHAAALINQPMRQVLAWVSDPNAATSGVEVFEALEKSPEREAMRLSALQFFNNNPATKTSVATAMKTALDWLTDPRAAALGDEPGDDQLDVKELLELKGTLYMLGGEDGLAAPLIAAMTAEIARQAKKLAGANGGRLDPALTIALDEAALICPVPLDRWTSDMGGRNITIHWCVQSRAQLIDRWGEKGAGAILTNTGAKLVFGGTSDPDDQRAWSQLSGERDVVVETRDPDGKVTSTTTRKEPVLSPAQIGQIPEFTALVLHNFMRASVGPIPMAWDRPDIRAAVAASPFRAVLETAYAEEGIGDELEFVVAA